MEKFGFIVQKEQEVIVDNLTPEHREILLSFKQVRVINEIKVVKNCRYRIIILVDQPYSVSFVSSDINHLKSNRTAISEVNGILRRAKVIDDQIQMEIESVRNNFSKFTHNLKSLCTLNIQEIEFFSPLSSTEDFKISRLKDWEIYVKELKSSDVKDLAKGLMRVYKNSQHIQNDILVYESLFHGTDMVIQKSDHSVHKVITRAVLCCASLLLEKDVRIKFGEANWTINVDYTSTQVALFYVMDNVIKYIKPDTDLEISFFRDKVLKETTVEFKMQSLYVGKDEEYRLFEEGYSGKYAISSNLKGLGLGFSRAEELLHKNNARLQFISSGRIIESFLNRSYGENTIKIIFR